MGRRRLAIGYGLVLAAFAVFTAYVVARVGLVGIFEPHFTEWGPAQVFADLVLMGLITIGWMVRDARQRGAAVWPYVVLTLAAGSIGPLLYLAVRAWQSPERRAA
ncbi:MAG: hypothetical protein KatS3mg062_1193 [Tepidiforma sp.]|nr:MAG: hypothetical protein KatS3mg062_1193 [Tepidiforma sp.]